ncbi:hypothetical protein FA95DRAFT_1551690 [Auriscalpium vulgare]|uniref:Uncharacterized protein n=1 Tax=Auriscalpium vulgare TaxID=40419 RepID=A0ACB8SCH2_9AGAM|nr:hypothetical protein FA95DRAFT_1551690 [Auriscalpium vulgare]
MSSSDTVGTRICLSGYLGTVRYVGTVDGTKGAWLGVEWDDPSRGRHDGSKDGRSYFTCLIPGAGSFIRPSQSIDYGRPFLRALTEKYIEIPHGSSAHEIVVLGSSNGAIQVEAVNLDKIRGKFARIERLREVSLDRENVSSVDPPGQIRDKCGNVRGVDLSSSLIPSWDVVALIAVELPLLERLSLNNNRLNPFTNPSLVIQAFSRLTELQLNGTLITWEAMINIISLIPTLRQIEMGYNRLTSLSTAKTPERSTVNVEIINLDGNQLSDWINVSAGLCAFPNLSRLIVSANPLASIPVFSAFQEPLHLKHLALSSTSISTWASIDALVQWCPELETLSLSSTPLVKDSVTGRAWRQHAIARLPVLRALDGTQISTRERTDSELFYLSHISHLDYPSPEARLADHPRWDALCHLHGVPDQPSIKRPKDDRLSGRLIGITARLSPTAPPPQSPSELASPISVRILPTAPLRHLRLKLLKSFKAPRGAAATVWMRMADGRLARIGEPDGSEDGREVDWWLEEGAEVVVHVESSR